MAMNEHILLKNNNKYIINIKFIKYFICGKTIKQLKSNNIYTFRISKIK